MLKYQFPAVKGKQAGKEYYICMVPLGLLGKIFFSDSNDVAPEHRAQRKLKFGSILVCGAFYVALAAIMLVLYKQY